MFTVRVCITSNVSDLVQNSRSTRYNICTRVFFWRSENGRRPPPPREPSELREARGALREFKEPVQTEQRGVDSPERKTNDHNEQNCGEL